MYIHTHTHTHVCICTYVCACVFTRVSVRTYLSIRYVNSQFLHAKYPRTTHSCYHSQQHKLYLPLPIQSVRVTCRTLYGLSVSLSVCLSVCLRRRCSDEIFCLEIGFQIRCPCRDVGISSCVRACVAACTCLRVRACTLQDFAAEG